MNKYEENVYKNIFEYPTKKIVELELKNEKLEKENKILRENAENNDKVVDKVNWEKKQLENNRDKAIEYIEEKFFDGMYKYQLLSILKGDSE